MHHAHPRKAQHIGDLVGVGEHGGRAVWNNGSRKFGGGQHAAFDMHVAVDQARDQVAAMCLDDVRIGTNAMRSVRANIGKAPVGHRHLPTIQHLAGLHVYQLAAAHNRVSGTAPCGDSDQTGGDIGPRFDVIFHPQMFHHFSWCSRGDAFNAGRQMQRAACSPQATHSLRLV